MAIASRMGIGSALLAAALLAACEGGGEGGAGGEAAEGGGPPAGSPTFYKDVLPILQQSCLHCHSEGRIGGFSLATYDEAKTQAGVVAAVTADGRMPPWHAIETDLCQPPYGFVGDPRLSDEAKATLRAWADADAPEGDPADAPQGYEPPPVDLPNADLELAPSEPSIVEGDHDQFVCVVYDPQLTQDVYVDGVNIAPGNESVAHHALVFRVDRSTADELSGGNERFDCFGGPPGDLIHAWAPGMQPLQLPATVGMPLSTDQVIVVQMHYHPTGTSTEEDASKIQLRYTEEPKWDFTIALPGNATGAPELLPGPNDGASPQFRIPAGEKDHVEAMAIEVPQLPIELPILVVATHMHYVGVDARFWVERSNPGPGEAESECFVHTPAWDFNWQRGYMYNAPIEDLPTVSGGDVLRLECHYNNSMSNPFVVKALADQGKAAPEDVVLGEQTLDEMCLGAIGFLVPHQ
ncbi:MAG: hypothetical protein HOW73_33370 [Polyangiaceae bacterium]|nr:hypothetical protein [Polyangiaceae bacterium]